MKSWCKLLDFNLLRGFREKYRSGEIPYVVRFSQDVLLGIFALFTEKYIISNGEK